MMKPTTMVLSGLLAGLLALPALGQVTYTAPQSQQATIFAAATTAQTSGCLANQGQNIWFSSYVVNTGNPADFIDYRLEYSYNSDAATCTTGTWFSMSDDATDTSSGEVVGIGAYPFVRANISSLSLGAATSVTAFYSTSSSSPSNLYGFYNSGQQVRRVVYDSVLAANNPPLVTIGTPYSSSAGFLLVTVLSGSFSGAASLGFSTNFGVVSASLPNFSLSGSGLLAVPMPASSASSISISFAKGTSNARFSVYWVFLPPGSGAPASAQPASPFNSESTSGANAAVQVQFSPSKNQAAFIYSISARCSGVGTAQLTITDQTASNTQIWSTAAAEVGATTFKYQWSPGLNSSLSMGDVVIAKLGACGVASTGTLDVQASVF
jgi:hypothetical protein